MGIDYLEIARRALAERKPSVQEAESGVPVGEDLEADPSIPVSDTQVEETIRHAAIAILNREGARLFFSGDILTVGIWSVADRPEVRAAIHTLYLDTVKVIHLEEAPAKYRQHKPNHLKTAQELATPDEIGVSWAQWEKTERNNALRAIDD